MKLNRVIVLGEPIGNKSQKYPDNILSTARYPNFLSLITFGLIWIIFNSVSSCYFLIVSLFQLLTPFSPTGRFSTFAPYASNKAIELYFLHLDNAKKKLDDWMINQRPIRVVTKHGLSTKPRSELKVGDVVLIEAEWRNEEVPADILLLFSPSRDVYINMASLTGEKDPVQKKVPEGLSLKSPKQSPVYGVLYTDPVSEDLDTFNGMLCFGTERYRCTEDNIILSGSILLQGTDIFGVVVATHTETKLHMKNTATNPKRGVLNSQLNTITKYTLLFLVCFITWGTINHIIRFPVDSSVMIFQTILMYFLLFNGLIAQTLHFSLDVVRRIQVKLYLPQIDVHNFSAVEDLGLLDAIVFDKTGTLTTNQLVPKVFSVPSVRNEDEIENHLTGSSFTQEIEENLHDLYLSVCLNNSVVRLADSRPGVVYFGTSSDEVVLMESIYHSANYLLMERENTNKGQIIHLRTHYEDDDDWELIQLFKYSSAKGKMSVIVRNIKKNEVYLVTKGSPERMIDFLIEEHKQVAEKSMISLAEQGLRVLMFGKKQLNWSEQQQQELENIREDQILLDSYSTTLEKDMNFIGCTGTEDSLQPQLRETIQDLREASIRTFVCTGDIKLTAKNIGINAGLLPNSENQIFDIHHQLHNTLEEQLRAVIDFDGEKGILIGKGELPEIIEHFSTSELFLQLINDPKVTGIVVYRAGPSMKSELAKFLKKSGLIISCVGDGANDIEMIKTADVGVGIKAGENQHAASSADIAVDSVSQLPNIILHDGKTNWYRNVKLTQLISSMKLTVILSILFYDWFTGFHVHSVYTGKMLLAFNLFYGWGVIVYGIFHLTLTRRESKRYPTYYRTRPGEELVSLLHYFVCWIRAGIDALLAIIICVLYSRTIDNIDDIQIPVLDDTVGMTQFSIFVTIMIWINVRVSVESGIKHWVNAKYIHITVFLTIIAFALFCFQSWLHLPSSFFKFIILSTIGYIIYTNILDKIINRFTNKISSSTFKVHVE